MPLCNIFLDYFLCLNPVFLVRDKGKLIEYIFLILHYVFVSKKLKHQLYYQYSKAQRLINKIWIY